ncbi:MAG: BatA domain-containing protein [Pirellulales bacterium]
MSGIPLSEWLSTMPLWAFSPFASFPLLAWGLAALIPIAIHLWSRRQYREHAWAAMPFLLAALRRQAKRLWFEQWVLLALRVLICLTLAVALADPMLTGLAALTPASGDAGSTHHLLVIDVSYSMGYRLGTQGERTAFDEAREALAQRVQRAPQGDGFSIVLLADSPRAAIGEPSFDRNAALDELQSLRISHGGADVRATLALIERLIADARQRFPRLKRTQVIFATDLGRQGWENAVVPEMASTWEKLAELATTEWIDVGREDNGNLAVMSLRLTDSLAVVGRGSRLEAEIRNFGASDVRAMPVEFEVDGRPLGVRSLDIPAGGQAVAVADVRFETPGDRIVSVAIRGDRLALDNRRWLSVPVRDRARVLCVEGRLDEAAYLALALNPSPRDEAAIRVEVAAESALLDRSLSAYDLICLCNVGRLTSAEAAALRDFVSPGGRLAIFVGDQVQGENYNLELGGQEQGGRETDGSTLRLLPAQLGAPNAMGLRSIDPLDYRDPLAAPFRGQERAGLLSTPIWCYLPAKLFAPQSAQVALAFDNGDPWIVHERRGRGEVWLITSAASPRSQSSTTQPPTPWSAWAAWPSFPPMIQQLLRESLAGRLDLRNALVGQPLAGRFTSGSAGAEVVVIPPDEGETGETLPRRASVERSNDDLRWSFVATASQGLYIARRGNEEERFAVNLDTRESDLTRLDPTLLPASMRRESSATEPREQGPSAISSGRSLFRHLLMVVLGLLIGESLLAQRLGRGDDRGQFRRQAGSEDESRFGGTRVASTATVEANGGPRG